MTLRRGPGASRSASDWLDGDRGARAGWSRPGDLL